MSSVFQELSSNLNSHQPYTVKDTVEVISIEESEESLKESSVQMIIIKPHKKISKKKQSLIKKTFNVQLMPGNLIYDVETLFIVGEIFVIFDFDNKYCEKTRISIMNNFKRIQSTAIHKTTRFIEIKLEYKSHTLKYFQHYASKLMNYPDSLVHEFGVLLQVYQNFCFECFEQIKQMNASVISSIPVQYYTKRDDDFEYKKQQFLNNFNQDEFVYVLEMGNNYTTFEFEIKDILVSEPLLLLMGTTLEQYERFLHRYGLNDFIDSRSTLAFNIYQLKSMLMKFGCLIKEDPIIHNFDPEQGIDVTLYTFDHIRIQAKIVCKTLLPLQQIVQSFDIKVQPNMLILVKYEIEPTSLQQLIQLRSNQQSNSLGIYDQGYINDIDYSLDYSLQTEVFFDMAKLHNLFSKTQQRTSYRILTPQEKLQFNSSKASCPYYIN